MAGPAVLAYLNERDEVVKKLVERLKVQPGEIFERVMAVQDELRDVNKALVSARAELARAKAVALAS